MASFSTSAKRSFLSWLLLPAACFAAWPNSAGLVAAESVRETDARYEQQFRAKLDELAVECEEQGLDAEAEFLRAWLPRPAADQLVLFTVRGRHEAARSAKYAGAAWWKRFMLLRTAQAVRLFELSREAARQRLGSLERMLLTKSVRENPAHAEARKRLGYVEHEGRFVTPPARRMLERGHVRHDRFGWLLASDVAKYEAGERRWGTTWITAEEEARRRARISQGWEIETDHYEITTNHSLEAGVALGRRLETLHETWRQLFAQYNHRAVRRAPARHQVLYYRAKDEYVAALKAAQPRIDMTLGIYFDNHRRAYFFAGENQSPATLFHEATHQLFQETGRVIKNVGFRNNFWIVEGIATYFESLTEHEGYVTLGGHGAGRMPAARHRRLVDEFYVPLEQTVALGMHDIQRHRDIAKLYSQFAGQATFLMHADDGRYRPAVVEYLEAVYTGRADPTTLARLCDTSYEELDRQYAEFLKRGVEAER